MDLKSGFKVTELGPLPEDWEVVRLGQVVEIYDKLRIPVKEEERQKQRKIYPYCGANGIIDYVESYIFDGEFVLLAEDGGHWGPLENSSYIMTGKFWVNNHAHVLKGIAEKLDNYFLMNSLNFLDLREYVGGDSRGKITQGRLKQIKIPLPPLPEQKAIARVLKTIQDAIEATEKVITATKELKKSLMEHLFTYGPVPISEKDRVRLKQTEIGFIPEDWEVVRLGEVADTFSGGTPSRKNPNYWNGDIPWAKSGDLKDTFIRSVEEFISEEGLENSSAKIVSAGTLLIAMYGATAGKVGIAGFDFAINQAICAIIPKKQPKTFENLFGFYYLIFARDKLLAERFGGAQPNLNQQIIKNFLIPLPPLPIQQKIAQILKAVDDKIEAEEKKKKALQDFFKTMLHHLMTGKIRVR